MDVQTELRDAIEAARRACDQYGIGGDAVAAWIAANPTVVALLRRPEIQSFVALEHIQRVISEGAHEPADSVLLQEGRQRVIRQALDR